MDKLLSEQAILQAIKEPIKKMNCRMSNTELLKNVEQAIKAIPSVEQNNSEDKIIRQTLENFMRGLWAEIQVCEMEYTTSEIYEMLLKEIFTDNHVAIPTVQDDDYVMIKRTTWEKIEKALDSVSARGC